jgi:hypothetical protein
MRSTWRKRWGRWRKSCVAHGRCVSLVGCGCYDRRVDYHAAIMWTGGGYTVRREMWAEDGNQSTADVSTKCGADSVCARIWHPVSWEESTLVSGCWGERAVNRDGIGERNVPCADSDPPVMLCVISLRPGLRFNIFAGVVCFRGYISK